MPILLVFSYIMLETVAFWAVSTWLGFWGAFFAMFALMFLGSVLAGAQIRRARSVGNLGLLMVAAILSSIPGYATSVLGLLLIFPPTRELVHGAAAKRLTAKLEDFGTRIYEHSPMSSMRTQYGSFTDAESSAPPESAEVIDEDEIREWTDNLSPDDFKKGPQ